MFKNCKIIAINPDPALYRNQKVEDRGKPEYVVSSSDLRLIMSTSPSKWVRGFVLPESYSLEYGGLLDCLVLTPEDFSRRYMIQPENYDSKGMECPSCKTVTDSKKCKACGVDRVETTITKPWSNQSTTCSDWVTKWEAAGFEVIKAETYKAAALAAKRIMDDKELSQLLHNADKQIWVEGEWFDEATGITVKVRCLIDYACRAATPFEKTIGDLKSTKDARLMPWASFARKVFYDMQGAWNMDMFNAATGRGATQFNFILSESVFPYEIGRRWMEEDPLQPEQDDFTPGRSKYRKAMALYCQCVKSGKWPCYDDTDMSSVSGWTKLSADAYDEQRRMFGPQFQVEAEQSHDEDEPAGEDEGEEMTDYKV